MTPHNVISRQAAYERGLKRYYTGEPCRRGHLSERYVVSGACIQCVSFKTPNKRSLRGSNVGWPSIGLVFKVQPAPTPEEVEAAFRMLEANGWHDHCVTEMRKNPELLARYMLPPDPMEQIRLMVEVERQRRIAEAQARARGEDT